MLHLKFRRVPRKSRERADIIQEYGSIENYPLFANIRPELRKDVAGRICYYPGQKFCYFRVPKAANSTITLTLASEAGLLTGRRFSGDSETWWDEAKRRLRRYPSLKLLPRLYTFTFVRNPYTRILSAYLDKFHRDRRERFAPKIGVTDVDREVSFLEFLQRLETQGLHADMHWAPQVDIIPYDLDRLRYVGRVESLEQDLDVIVRKLFGKPLELKTKQSGRTVANERAREYLGPEERKLIERLYAQDFERFYPEGKPY